MKCVPKVADKSLSQNLVKTFNGRTEKHCPRNLSIFKERKRKYCPTKYCHTNYCPTNYCHTKYCPTKYWHTKYCPTKCCHTKYCPATP